MYKIQTGAPLGHIHRILDNEASTADPAVDVVCPQSILEKRSDDIQCKAVRKRVKIKVEGDEKPGWLCASTIDACS